MALTKRLKAAYALVDRTKQYSLEEGIETLKSVPKAKFDETVELSIKLGVDTKQADQQVRGTVLLPHGTGKTTRVVVIAEGDDIKIAEEAGADLAGAKDVIEKIQEGWLEFDCLIAVPAMMKHLSRLGKVLGPRGLMPNPKIGTVTTDVGRAVKEMKAGRIEYRADKASDVHAPVGKISFGAQHIVDNIRAIMTALQKAKPSSSKGQYLKKIVVSSTMGPGVELDVHQFGV